MERAYVFTRTAEGREYVQAEIPVVPFALDQYGFNGTPLTRAEVMDDPGKLAALTEWERGDDSGATEQQRELDEEAAWVPTAAEVGEIQRMAYGAPHRPPRHLHLVK